MEVILEAYYVSPKDYVAFIDNIDNGLDRIQSDFPGYDITKKKAIPYCQDFNKSTIRLKPLPDEMPERMKQAIIRLFREGKK
jgi:hypothetical protein